MKRWRNAYFDIADGFPPEWRSLLCWAIELPDGGMIGEGEIVRLELNGWHHNG